MMGPQIVYVVAEMIFVNKFKKKLLQYMFVCMYTSL
jgi:hypothetical protein